MYNMEMKTFACVRQTVRLELHSRAVNTLIQRFAIINKPRQCSRKVLAYYTRDKDDRRDLKN